MSHNFVILGSDVQVKLNATTPESGQVKDSGQARMTVRVGLDKTCNDDHAFDA